MLHSVLVPDDSRREVTQGEDGSFVRETLHPPGSSSVQRRNGAHFIFACFIFILVAPGTKNYNNLIFLSFSRKVKL